MKVSEIQREIDLWGGEVCNLSDLVPDPDNPRVNAIAAKQLVSAIVEVGFGANIIAQKDTGRIIAGHTRYKAALTLGLERVPVRWVEVDDRRARAMALADNRIGEIADWDVQTLTQQLSDYSLEQAEALGFDSKYLESLANQVEGFGPLEPTEVVEDEVPYSAPERVKLGEVWQLGEHRLMCGDSTDPNKARELFTDAIGTLIHADPPYGMGKEKDGVANDNLYQEKLDAFQMNWWKVWRKHISDNGSAYIWGNAEDLWRLWFKGGLKDSERLTLRNEIVWDKLSIAGMASPALTQYPTASERCLFFQFGDQFLGNINAADFPEEWEPIRKYLADEAQACAINANKIREVCGVSMFSHWFTRSQFTLIPENHYRTLQEAYPGHFSRKHSDLKREWKNQSGKGRAIIHEKLSIARSYFDNAHDSMRDTWDFPRVIGEERYGHATPKPVAMMARCLRSSADHGQIVAEPFLGTGSTIIAAEQTNRICYGMELSPAYCDIVLERWEKLTGKKAQRVD